MQYALADVPPRRLSISLASPSRRSHLTTLLPKSINNSNKNNKQIHFVDIFLARLAGRKKHFLFTLPPPPLLPFLLFSSLLAASVDLFNSTNVFSSSLLNVAFIRCTFLVAPTTHVRATLIFIKFSLITTTIRM